MSGVKISEFTETTDPSGFEAAGVQGGVNRKFNLGNLSTFPAQNAIYVSYAGDDSRSGTSPDKAVRTLEYAYELASADINAYPLIILMDSGTYTFSPSTWDGRVSIYGPAAHLSFAYAPPFPPTNLTITGGPTSWKVRTLTLPNNLAWVTDLGLIEAEVCNYMGYGGIVGLNPNTSGRMKFGVVRMFGPGNGFQANQNSLDMEVGVWEPRNQSGNLLNVANGGLGLLVLGKAICDTDSCRVGNITIDAGNTGRLVVNFGSVTANSPTHALFSAGADGAGSTAFAFIMGNEINGGIALEKSEVAGGVVTDEVFYNGSITPAVDDHLVIASDGDTEPGNLSAKILADEGLAADVTSSVTGWPQLRLRNTGRAFTAGANPEPGDLFKLFIGTSSSVDMDGADGTYQVQLKGQYYRANFLVDVKSGYLCRVTILENSGPAPQVAVQSAIRSAPGLSDHWAVYISAVCPGITEPLTVYVTSMSKALPRDWEEPVTPTSESVATTDLTARDPALTELNRGVVTSLGDNRLFDWDNAGWNQVFHVMLSRNTGDHHGEWIVTRNSLGSEAFAFPIATKGTVPVLKGAKSGSIGMLLATFGAAGTYFLSVRTLLSAAVPREPDTGLTPTDVFNVTVSSSGGSTSGTHYTFLPQSSAPASAEGTVYFNDNLKSWVGVDAAGNELEFGREEKQRCLNNTGATIANGKAVYVSGFSGGVLTIALARSNSKSTCVLLGIATQDIANGAIGEVCFKGFARGVPTSGIGAAGALVYVSETTAGELTTAEPSYPNLSALMGRIGASHATDGSIAVFPDTDPNQSTTGVPGLVFRESTMPAAMYAAGKGSFPNSNGSQFGTSFYASAGWKPNKSRFRQSQGTISSNARVGLYNEAGILLAQTALLSGSGDSIISGTFAAELSVDLVPGTLYHAVICGKINGNLVYGTSPGSLNANPRMGFQGQIVMDASANCPSDISSILGSSSSDRAWIEFYR